MNSSIIERLGYQIHLYVLEVISDVLPLPCCNLYSLWNHCRRQQEHLGSCLPLSNLSQPVLVSTCRIRGIHDSMNLVVLHAVSPQVFESISNVKVLKRFC